MTDVKTFDQIWDDYLAGQAKIEAAYRERQSRYVAAWANHVANLHTTSNPMPTPIGPWYSAADYERDSAMGRLTD